MPVRIGKPSARNDGFLEEYQDCVLGPVKPANEWYLAERVFRAVLGDSRTHTVGIKALAEAFVNSWSFYQTRALWDLIAAEPLWESQELRRLEYAVSTNRQVYDANHNGALVPELVKELVAKFEPIASDPWDTSDPLF